MKNYLFFIVLLVMASCQTEQFTIVDSSEENRQDTEVLELVKKVTSHDGSYDNIVDDSSCFSINYPYICTANGRRYPVNSPADLEPFTSNDVLIPQFPVTITFADHIAIEVPDYDFYLDLIEQCATGQLLNNQITCIDLSYPVSLSLYDTENTNFETLTFNHDSETFLGIDDLSSSIIANLSYPISVQLSNGESLVLTSNSQLKDEILQVIPICED